jgi:hypothetical protein
MNIVSVLERKSFSETADCIFEPQIRNEKEEEVTLLQRCWFGI